MKALTVWQPWATFIADGMKRYETRHWLTSYRGNLAIHAGKRWTSSERYALTELCLMYPGALGDHQFAEMPLGCIVAAVRLVAVHRVEDIREEIADMMEIDLGNYSDGRFAWELEVVKLPPEPIPAVGQQGLWDWIPGLNNKRSSQPE